MRFFDFKILNGDKDHQECGGGDDQFHENCKRIDGESSAKTNKGQPAGERPPEQDKLEYGKAQAEERENGIPEFIALVAKHDRVKDEDCQGENRQKDFRLDGKVIERLKKNVPNVRHQCLAPE